MGKSTVLRCVDELIGAGFVVRLKKGGTGHCTHYGIAVPGAGQGVPVVTPECTQGGTLTSQEVTNKGGPSASPANETKDGLKAHRLTRMLNHGIPVTLDTYEAWASLLASCNGVVPATAALEHLRDGKVRDLEHAGEMVASLIASKGGNRTD